MASTCLQERYVCEMDEEYFWVTSCGMFYKFLVQCCDSGRTVSHEVSKLTNEDLQIC